MGTAAAYETNDLNSAGPEAAIKTTSFSLAAASTETIVDNGDGTFTYTQIIDENSDAPQYMAPVNGGGFGIYSWYDQDYGWNHTFDAAVCTNPNLTINSVQIEIRAWDVDAEPERGLNGEYDHITADGIDMNPVYLQGTGGTWSLTTFDVNTANLLDDCNLEMFIDIDMFATSRTWATELDYSKLVVNYSLDGSNQAPFQPEVAKRPADCVADDDALSVAITGPNPADPNGDAVSYEYRWFVDVGTGGFLDDDFAGRGEHTGSSVPATDTEVDDIWMVQVTAVDAHGAKSPFTQVEFVKIVDECAPNGEIPEFPTIVLPMAAILGIALIIQRRKNE